MIFGYLAKLANRLDSLGLYEEANQVDSILKEFGSSTKQGGFSDRRFEELWQAQQEANRPKQKVKPDQKKQQIKIDPKDLQSAANKIRQQVFQNPKVPGPYKNTGTLMKFMQQMIIKGQAKDVASASQLLMKRLQRFQ